MNIKKTLLGATAVTILAGTMPVIALAQPINQKLLPEERRFNQMEKQFEGTAGGSLIDAITGIVNALLALAALIAAIFVVIGGVRYITSQGDEDAAAAAKNTVLYALIGVIVIALSAVVVNFIIANIPGVTTIPAP